jgi:diadenosine tetraphosphate (Ap4A) HIT family hydrolase
VVVPRRHVPRFYDLDVEEQRRVWDMVTEVQRRVIAALRVDAVDIGFADSPDADGHMVVHVVPRSGATQGLPAGIEWVR